LLRQLFCSARELHSKVGVPVWCNSHHVLDPVHLRVCLLCHPEGDRVRLYTLLGADLPVSQRLHYGLLHR